ncbi:M23 family metallopeptidase, partial [Streptomyces calidiresistens]|uniref:M23 family metallopeptidase n=1 Tax=Streptomyces calidiresistens TaxID=1485586 RepID=UPI0015FC87D6
MARPFEPPPRPWQAGHRGVDLPAEVGAVVLSPVSGRVVFAGPVAGRGVLVIELDEPGGPPPPAGGASLAPDPGQARRTTFEPVVPLVGPGRRVMPGDPVARLAGGPHHCDRPCLHWGLRAARLRGADPTEPERYLDPLSLLRRGPARLLPVTGVPPLPAEGIAPDPGRGTAEEGKGCLVYTS